MPFDASRIDRIREKLGQVVARGARPFGVEGHEMLLRPPVSRRMPVERLH